MASTSSSSLGESLTPSMNAATAASTNTNSTSTDTSRSNALVSTGVMVVDESPGSQNAPTSSSDKKTTKLSTSEQKDLNSSSRASVGIEMEDETSTTTATTTANSVYIPVNAIETNDNNSQASHLDEDEGDVDDDEIVTEEVCSATTIETDAKNKTSSVGDVSGGSISHNDEEMHDFSSSSASSGASSSSRNLIRKFSGRKTSRGSTASNNNNIDVSVLDESEAKLMQTLGPHIPIISSGGGSRKREHNRRKCSDPMSVKKLPRLRESDEEDDEYDFDFFDEDGEDFDEDFEIGRGFGYFDLSNTTARNRRKTRSSTRSSGSTGGIISTKRLNELMAVSGAFGPHGVGMEGTNDELSIPGSPMEVNDFGMKDLSEEKDRVIIINSSDGEFETCITETKSECNVKWKNHEAHILSAFEALLESETFCDVTLVCDIEEETKDDEGLEEDDAEKRVPEGRMKDDSSSGGVRKLKAHKIILSACSDYFQRIFADSPCKHSVIVLKDFQAWEIQALLDFMYRGEVDVSLERLDILVKSAESLQIRGLLEAIAKLGPDPLAFTSENQRINDTHGICDPPDCISIDDYTANERSRMSTREMSDSHISPVWDDGALNLSMDMKTKEKSSSPDIMKRLDPLDSPQRDSPHQLNLCMNEIPPEAYGILGQSRDDLEMKESPGMMRQSSLFEINHMGFGFQESDRQNSSRTPSTPPTFQNSLHVPVGCEKQQSAFPRRKQARPRRRSGDFVAQDLSKIPSNLSLNLPNENDIEVQSTRGQSPDLQSEYNESIKDLSSEDKRDTFKSKRVELSSNIPIQLEKYRDDFSDTENTEENPNGISLTPIRTLGEMGGGGGALMSRLVHRRPRSSRRFNEDNGASNPMNLRHSRSSRSNNSHHHLKDGGERVIINEESPLDSRGLDYTTGMNEGNHKKLKKSSSSSKLKGISSGGSHLGKLGFPGVPPPPFPPTGHLPFLRNWSPTMSQLHNNTNAMTMTPPPGLHRNSPIKPDMGDSDDGISSAADQCQSPPLSPFPLDPKHLLSNSRHPHEFPLFGMHQDQQQQQHHRPNLPSSLTFNKHSPPSPSFFMNPLAAAAAMSLKPLGAKRDGHPGGDEPGGDNNKTPSTPPDLFPGPGFPMGLPLHLTPGGHLHVHGIHPQTSKDDRDRKSGRPGKDGGPRDSPLGWPGLPLGPPPIFGRHRAQHSAPRGGPPRAWSNADLTEALHNVWNKKMTTSQASRIFGIPYNSLLMYVRGKYGKSLKLDLLKKGLDQALENSQKALKAASAGGTSGSNPSTSSSSSNTNTTTSNTPSNNRSTSTPNSESTSTLTTTTASPTTNNNNHNSITNSTSSPSSVKGHHHHHHHHHANLLSLMSGGAHNERNNNNTPPTGMGHLHPHHLSNHHHHHNKSSKSHNHGSSSHSTNNHSIELPHELPPGFNPFSAASLFGEYPNPFPFASALSHILPQASLVNQQHTTGNGSSSNGGHSAMGLSLTNHSSRKDSLKSEISVGDDEK